MIMMLGWLGIYSPVALGAIGSSIGCTLAGQAAAGALLDAESGYGKYIGMTAMPSTQSILGIVIMFSLNRTVTLANSPGLAAIGLLSGLALLVNGIYQGRALVSAIDTAKNKPEVFGISLAPAAIVEGFAVFAFVFALVMSSSLPD
ncbi:ATP synthase subunit C [Salinicola sp. V024]|uniref:ATP synthase subunit C n=1 Tax=Salinicola sp. V024 TaxID=3459609 RepID=UPI004044C315